ncbi:HD-GYP domain-containing protein [Lutibacter sp. B2]|nr:HD-GYP domain-containing protein [Lutibacter sp. B2]
MRLVPIEAVKEGTVLAQTIYNENGQVLLAKGVKFTENLKDRVKEHKFYSIYIIDEYSQGEIEDIIKPQVRKKAIDAIHSTLNIASNLDDINTNSFQKKNLEKKLGQQIDQVQAFSKLIVDDICNQQEVMINLVDIRNMDNYTFHHSVNSAVLGLVLGIGHGLNKEELYDLTMGIMLHDIGKMFVPMEILNKKGKLDEVEYKIMKDHTVRGFDFLKDHTDLNSKVRIIALQHHERVDGTGYPHGLKDEKINKLAKIGAIVDVYDAFVSDRSYRKALSPNEAVEYIMGSGGRFFDMDMVQTFVKKINPYPVGSAVKLSNNCIAIVEAINSLYILRPIVRVVKQEGKIVEPFLCDLTKACNIVIEGICYEI